jgi:hypothetical protein
MAVLMTPAAIPAWPSAMSPVALTKAPANASPTPNGSTSNPASRYPA